MNQPDHFTLLRTALRSNAAFSTLSGLLFVTSSGAVAAYVGGIASSEILAIGVCLLGFAAFLLWLSARSLIPRGWVLGVITMDLGWVIGTGLICLTDLFSTQGKMAAAGIAGVVAFLALLQWIGLQRARAAGVTQAG